MINCFSGFPEFPFSILNEGFLKSRFGVGGNEIVTRKLFLLKDCCRR